MINHKPVPVWTPEDEQPFYVGDRVTVPHHMPEDMGNYLSSWANRVIGRIGVVTYVNPPRNGETKWIVRAEFEGVGCDLWYDPDHLERV